MQTWTRYIKRTQRKNTDARGQGHDTIRNGSRTSDMTRAKHNTSATVETEKTRAPDLFFRLGGSYRPQNAPRR